MCPIHPQIGLVGVLCHPQRVALLHLSIVKWIALYVCHLVLPLFVSLHSQGPKDL